MMGLKIFLYNKVEDTRFYLTFVADLNSIYYINNHVQQYSNTN